MNYAFDVHICSDYCLVTVGFIILQDAKVMKKRDNAIYALFTLSKTSYCKKVLYTTSVR